MAKAADVTTLDALLDRVAGSTQMYLCSAQPANHAGIAAVALTGAITMAPGDFVKAAGSPDGRQVTVASKSGVPITASGSANHVALSDGTTLRYVTTATAQTVTNGNTATLGAWTVTVRAPV